MGASVCVAYESGRWPYMCMSQLIRRMCCVGRVDESTTEQDEWSEKWASSGFVSFFSFVFIDFLFWTNVEPLERSSHTVCGNANI